jgi:hypothetical protein
VKRTSKAKKETIKFTVTEVQVAMWLIANLEPDEFVSDRAKALIYKAKDLVEGTRTGRIEYVEVII